MKHLPAVQEAAGKPLDRGAWRAAVHGVAEVGHDLGFKEVSPFPASLFSGLEDLVFLSILLR